MHHYVTENLGYQNVIILKIVVNNSRYISDDFFFIYYYLGKRIRFPKYLMIISYTSEFFQLFGKNKLFNCYYLKWAIRLATPS